MPIQDAITAYQQAIANFEQKNQEAADLRNTRLPELTSRLNANRLSMDSAQSAMRNAISDADYDTAKQTFQQAEAAYADCAQLITNVEAKIKSWREFGLKEHQTKITELGRTMWQLKQAEVMAALPAELPTDLRIGLQKLMTINSMQGGVGDGYYGSRINKIYGLVEPEELTATRSALLAEMGL